MRREPARHAAARGFNNNGNFVDRGRARRARPRYLTEAENGEAVFLAEEGFNKIYSRFVESAASVATRALAHLFVSSRDGEQGTPPAAAGGTPQPQRRAGAARKRAGRRPAQRPRGRSEGKARSAAAGRRSGPGRSEERAADDPPGPKGARARPERAQGDRREPAAPRRASPQQGRGRRAPGQPERRSAEGAPAGSGRRGPRATGEAGGR